MGSEEGEGGTLDLDELNSDLRDGSPIKRQRMTSSFLLLLLAEWEGD